MLPVSITSVPAGSVDWNVTTWRLNCAGSLILAGLGLVFRRQGRDRVRPQRAGHLARTDRRERDRRALRGTLLILLDRLLALIAADRLRPADRAADIAAADRPAADKPAALRPDPDSRARARGRRIRAGRRRPDRCCAADRNKAAAPAGRGRCRPAAAPDIAARARTVRDSCRGAGDSCRARRAGAAECRHRRRPESRRAAAGGRAADRLAADRPARRRSDSPARRRRRTARRARPSAKIERKIMGLPLPSPRNAQLCGAVGAA